MPVTPFTTHDQTQTELLNTETQTKPKHTDRTRRPRQGTESRKTRKKEYSRYREYWRANREDCDSQRKRENDKEESMITTTNHEQEL